MTVAFILVVASGLIHSIWNMFTKRSRNKVVFLWLCQWAAILLYLPLTVRELLTGHGFPVQGIPLLLASMALHGLYVLMLARTYTVGDLSQVYPIMRGTSPLLVPVIGVIGLGETLKLVGWAGVLCIVTGIFIIGGVRFGGWFKQGGNNAVRLAFSVGILITGYTVIDKMALAWIPPLTLNEAGNIGNMLALSWVVVRSGEIANEWRIHWKTILMGGIMAPGGYLLFLTALQTMPAAQLAPMREIGTVFGTILGIALLHEPQGRRRIASSVLITAGVILLSR